jgi:hypothetical protein
MTGRRADDLAQRSVEGRAGDDRPGDRFGDPALLEWVLSAGPGEVHPDLLREARLMLEAIGEGADASRAR